MSNSAEAPAMKFDCMRNMPRRRYYAMNIGNRIPRKEKHMKRKRALEHPHAEPSHAYPWHLLGWLWCEWASIADSCHNGIYQRLEDIVIPAITSKYQEPDFLVIT